MAKHSSILAWKIPWRERLVGYSPWGCKESDMTEHAHVQSIHGASLLGCFSCVQLFATLWTEVCQAPLQTRILEWVAIPFSKGSSQLRDRMHVT